MRDELILSLREIAATYGTPCYVYDKSSIVDFITAYQQAFGDTAYDICYAVKANDSLAILQLMHNKGLGFDVVSGGELQRVFAAINALNDKPKKIIYSGVGKTVDEINLALDVGIDAFDIESIPELKRIILLAKNKGIQAPISIRYNPNVDAKTHPYISTGLHENKFGLDDSNALLAHDIIAASEHAKLVGINMHIGSQITDLRAFESALSAQASFIGRCKLRGCQFSHINCGGGLGLDDEEENDLSNIEQLVTTIRKQYPKEHVIIEPGRSLVGRSGYLLMQVQYIKQQANNSFVIVDAGMNDYMRVVLYGVEPKLINLTSKDIKRPIRVVGPVCESGDFFTKEILLGAKSSDILALVDAGAYGASMASNYNARMRPAEVLLDNNQAYLIKPREKPLYRIDEELKSLHHVNDVLSS